MYSIVFMANTSRWDKLLIVKLYDHELFTLSYHRSGSYNKRLWNDILKNAWSSSRKIEFVFAQSAPEKQINEIKIHKDLTEFLIKKRFVWICRYICLFLKRFFVKKGLQSSMFKLESPKKRFVSIIQTLLFSTEN